MTDDEVVEAAEVEDPEPYPDRLLAHGRWYVPLEDFEGQLDAARADAAFWRAQRNAIQARLAELHAAIRAEAIGEVVAWLRRRDPVGLKGYAPAAQAIEDELAR